MSAIEINDLKKHFRVLNRRTGLSGSFRDLLSRDYRIVKAVDGISLQIKEGEIVGFLGPNGAGKSTTIKMMTGVLEPTSGKVLVNDHSPFKHRQKNAQHIGVVFGQRTQLWWPLPVIESFKILKEMYRIDNKVFEENLGIFNELVNLKDLYSTPVRFLSLGQRMLCDIASSFLHNPKIIFLDEPTIGLDIVVKSQIRKLVKSVNASKKTTVILTTHDISDIEALCNRIIVIDKGSKIFDGEIERIKKIFGSYRTLKISFDEDKIISTEELTDKLEEKLQSDHSIVIKNKKDGWVNLIIDQEQHKLSEILNFLMQEYAVKDVKIEEIQTENIIKKIYEGTLI